MSSRSASAPRSADAPAAAGHPLRWVILGVVIAGECMELLDGTIVNVAAPTIREELGASAAALQWLAGGYALAIASGLLPAGRLGDVLGRRRMFLMGMVGFTLTSLLCGVAPTTGVLVACRIVQGLSAALVLGQTVAVIQGAFPAHEIAKAYGIFGPVMSLSAVLGPIVGGALVQADLFGTGWRLVFLVNLPIGLLTAALALRVLPESRMPGAPTLDLGGALLATLAMGSMVFPLIQGRERHWPAWTFALLAASVALFAAFAWHVRRSERAGGHPLITPSVMRKRGFAVGLVMVVLFTIGGLGLNLALTLYYQLGLGYSALHAGMSFAPWSLGAALGGIVSGLVLTPRYGRRVLHGGMLVMLAGVLAVLVVVHARGQQLTTADLAVPTLLCGFGNGLMGAPLFAVLLAPLDEHEAGSAGGLINALAQLGAAIGVAVLGAIFFAAIAVSFAVAIERVLLAEVGVLLVTGALTFLLPRTVGAVEGVRAA